MSFSYSAQGTRNEVVDQLDGLHDSQMGNDNFGAQIRDAIVDAVSVGTELAGPIDQRYEVSVVGHSSHGGVVTLDAKVKVVFQVNPVGFNETEVPVTNVMTGGATSPPLS